MPTTNYKKPKKITAPSTAPKRAMRAPLDGASIGSNDIARGAGIKIRGTGAATKGIKARGPMG